MSIFRDKSPLITSFLLPLLTARRSVRASSSTPISLPPLFLGVSGIQGSGKTSLCTQLTAALSSHPHSLRVVTFSIDDIYLPYSELTALSLQHPQNPFLRQRGSPGTHDITLGEVVFAQLAQQEPVVAVPAYDKSQHGGKGDRVPIEQWVKVSGPYDVVVFEGWCVGFHSLPESEVERKWKESKKTGRGTLGTYRLEDIQWVNRQLEEYKGLWERLDALVHIDAEKLEYVYDWRIEQEHSLIAQKGDGMTDDQVRAFVDSYMPSYELYLDTLREGLFKNISKEAAEKKQLRIVIGKDWNEIEVTQL
ncbi:P-loop containing nucleoside triphosphate hydrolase protein [Kalaharituber pfeilii]|nr:P-loop containing nucleoside triphosphate hydrolase protein [Kalaharituber pfeilii]